MLALGSDHAGYPLKHKVMAYLDAHAIAYHDYGTYTEASCDYPDYAKAACEAVVRGEADKALLFCGTGVGISMAANKVRGIRAACCSDYFSAKYTRLHNDANALCLGARVVADGLALELVEVFLNTPFEGGKHARRIDKLTQIENEQAALAPRAN